MRFALAKLALSLPELAPRWGLILLWLVAVAAGSWLVDRRAQDAAQIHGVEAGCPGCAPRVSWLASRDLPAGHRLTEADLELPADLPRGLAARAGEPRPLVGLYLTADLPAGAPVGSAPLQPHPRVHPKPGTVAFWLAVADGTPVNLLEVGEEVALCAAEAADPPCPIPAARVLAVDCRGPLAGDDAEAGAAEEECWLIVQVSAAEGAVLETHATMTPRRFRRGAPPQEEATP